MRVAIVVAVLLALLPDNARAQYVGLEPDRVVALLDLASARGEADALAARGEWEQAAAAFRRTAATDPHARLGVAVALFQQSQPQAALEELAGAGPEDLALRYARVLLRLHAEPRLGFSSIREALAAVLSSDPFVRDAFDVWLGLNPTKKELRERLHALDAVHDARADWQRAEVLLRLDDARTALSTLERIHTTGTALRNLIDRALARANFQLKEDAAGQAAYERLVGRLDESTAGLLFRDIAAVASAEERKTFGQLALGSKTDFFRRFWTSRNPMPVQQQNPRLGEHYRRLAQAFAEFALQSNGRGYFTDRETFNALSPQLPYYDSERLFGDGAASRYWLDPRGLVLLRHGEPELRIGPRSVGGSEPSESWGISHYGSRPLVFHFVRRASVGEWALVLNLGVAATGGGATPDEPKRVAQELTAAVYPLYESRLALNALYQQAAQARSGQELENILTAESEMMAAYLKAALTFDSTSYYTRENTLPLIVAVSNYYAGGKPAMDIQFGVDLENLNVDKLGALPSLRATVVLYDKQWTAERGRVEQTFPLDVSAARKKKMFVARIPLVDLEPEDYRLALSIYQPESGRIGIARGRHEVAYVGDGSLGLSDLVMVRSPREARQDAAHEQSAPALDWTPQPVHVVSKSIPASLVFELYNLQPDETGKARYEVEERVLTLSEDPAMLQKIAGYGMLAGQILFPLAAFAGQAGGGVLAQASASETEGLRISKRIVDTPAGEAVTEDVKSSLRTLKPGIYAVYVTVRDLNSGEIGSRYLTLRVAP